MEIFLIIAGAASLFGLAVFVGWQIARTELYCRWQGNFGKHRCGHLQEWGGSLPGSVCNRCGEKDGWTPVVARAKFLWGWEVKQP
jgi:hypothetical protein